MAHFRSRCLCKSLEVYVLIHLPRKPTSILLPLAKSRNSITSTYFPTGRAFPLHTCLQALLYDTAPCQPSANLSFVNAFTLAYTCCFYNIASIVCCWAKRWGEGKVTTKTTHHVALSDLHSPYSHITSLVSCKDVHSSQMQTLTIPRQVHATEHQRPNELSSDVSVKVDKYRRQILIGIVGYAGGRDSFDEFHISELFCKST